MRCEAAGCGRFVQAGAVRCRRHGGDAEAGGAVGGGAETGTRAAGRFRELLARGEYRALFEPPLGEVLAQAAADRPLLDEIGALRVALARLLAEEEDASKLATGVARLAGVAIQAAKARREVEESADDGLTALLTRILAEAGQDPEPGGEGGGEDWA